jgi:nicotinamidase-related amidase
MCKAPPRSAAALFLALASPAFGAAQKPAEPPRLRPVMEGSLRLRLRSRVQPSKGRDEWREVVVAKELPVAETALLLCDVWNKHWCKGANERLAPMLPRMSEVVRFARAHGVQIVHAPSGTMGFYTATPQRLRAQAAPFVQPPKPLKLPDPPLPVDASDNGCTDQPPCRCYSAWTRQHPAIDIAEPDAISDKGHEVYNLFRQLGIKNMIILGVHTNMCVLGRSFAIKQMTRWGIRCILVRDLTDTMYNPRRPPHVSHERGTELVIEHIEKHWCPSVLSDDLLKIHR